MRVVLYDAIQEAHVGESLARAFRAAGHEVYATGQVNRGFRFRPDADLVRLFGPHLDRIRDFRPDWVIVMRPASAPAPVLDVLRATGAHVAAWLSDDPVLYDLSYGPVVDLYDLVLHCGDARVLRFYEERFGRPTGVNFPFWTDSAAFPRVHGSLPREHDVLFLGNVAGPVRRRRYAQLAAMEHSVRLYGQADEDPAGIWGGFLDTDAEVVDAGARTAVALNIPQFFEDHRGLETWFDGLDRLGWFELPSRVVQYAAMGLPTVSIIPGGSPTPAFPELAVVDSPAQADAWLTDLLAGDALSQLSDAVHERFQASFTAASRVLAFEELTRSDAWRSLDAHERAVWFAGFDPRGTAPSQAADDGAVAVVSDVASAPSLPPEAASTEDLGSVGEAPSVDLSRRVAQLPRIAVVHAQEPPRFSALDVLLRDAIALGSVSVLGPGTGAESVTREGAAPFRRHLDAAALLSSPSPCPEVLVLAEGVGVAEEDADALHAAGVATVLLARSESLTVESATPADLVVAAGPGAAGRGDLVRALPHGLRWPGLVDRAFRDALPSRPAPGAALVLGPDEEVLPLAAGLDADRIGRSDLADLPAAGLAAALSRETLLLDPVRIRSRRLLPELTPYAVSAAGRVLVPRFRGLEMEEPLADRLLRSDGPVEAERRLARAGRSPEPPAAEPRLDAAVALADWCGRARAEARRRAASAVDADAAAPAAGTHRFRLGAGRRLLLPDGLAADGLLRLGIRPVHSGLLAGVTASLGDDVAAVRAVPGRTAAVVATLPAAAAGDELVLRFDGDPVHPWADRAEVRAVVEVHALPGVRRPDGAPRLTLDLVPEEDTR